MPFNARDLWVVLKAQDLATRALNTYSRNVRRAGDATRLAQLQAQRAAAMSRLEQTRLATENVRLTNSQLSNQKAAIAAAVANGKLNGITTQQVAAMKAASLQVDKKIIQNRDVITGLDRTALAEKNLIARFDTEANAIKRNNEVMERNARNSQILSNKFKSVAQTAYAASFAITGLGIAGAIGIKKAVDAAVEYNRTVALTKTQVDGFAASLKQLSDIGIRAANDIAVPFEQLQPALYDIFSSTNANLKQSEILLRAFSKAAVAGQVDLQDASRSTMQLMNAFKIPFEDVNKVLDLQFQLVRKGVGTYGQFANVIGRAVPSAVRAGQSLQTLDAMLVFLTRNGLSAAMAAASAGRALDAFANPKADAALQAMGIHVSDLKGNFLPLVDILGQLSKKIGSLPDKTRSKALAEIFKGAGGTIQALRFINQVIKPAQYKQFVEFMKNMGDSTGQFAKAYNQMADTTAAKSQLLKNRWTAIKIELGNQLIPVFNTLLDILSKALSAFSKLSPHTKNMIVQFIAWGTAVALIVGPLLAFIGLLGSVASALAGLGLSLGAVIGAVVGGIAVIVGLGAAFYLAYQRSILFRGLIEDLGRTFDKLWHGSIIPFVQGMRGAFDEFLLPALTKLGRVIENNIIPVLDNFVRTFQSKILPIVQETFRHLKDLASGGFQAVSWAINQGLIPAIKMATQFYWEHKRGIDQILTVMGQLVKVIGIIIGAGAIGALVTAIILVIGYLQLWVGIITHLLDWLSKLVNIVREAWSWFAKLSTIGGRTTSEFAKLGDSTGRTTSEFYNSKNAANGLATQLRQASSDAAVFRTWLDRLSGGSHNLAAAQDQVTIAADALSMSIRYNGKSFDGNTVSGARNRDMYIQGVAAAKSYSQAIYDNTHSSDRATVAYNAMIKKLDAAAKAAGMTKAQIAQLHRSLDLLPNNIPVRISLKVAEDAVAKQAIAAGYKIIPAFAEGGIMPGPRGKPGLAILHGGEEVIPADKVSRDESSKTITINNYITTQEIRPEYHSERLGFLLAGRI